MGADYRRRLPHWHPDGRTFFVTWRLHGSRPHCPGGPAMGPREADVVADEILGAHAGAGVEALDAWVVMPNHVHLLVRPRGALLPVLRGIKGASARRANQLLQRRGRFWQEESFDRWVRDEGEFQRFKMYIEENPVSARLVSDASAWRWSSVGWPG